jgi:transposase-like protein
MAAVRKRGKKEKDITDRLLDNIDFRGLTRGGAAGRGGLIKQLTGRMLRKALEAETAERLGYGKRSNAGGGGGSNRNGRTENSPA